MASPIRGMKIERPGVVGALVVGGFATILVILQQLHEPGHASDLDQILIAARALLSGQNPYEVVGPGKEFEWRWPLYYPLPTVLLTVPFAAFPLPVARVLFSGIGATIFGYALTRKGEYWRLPFCLGAAFLLCLWRTQWSLYLTAAFFLPLAAIFLVAKPNIAVAFVAGARTRRQLAVIFGAGALFVVAALLAQPDWIRNWFNALLSKEFISSPITNPGGFLLLLSLLRWRRPEARVFTALVAVPQTPSLYDLVPLIVIPRSLREVNVLTLLTSVLFWVVIGMERVPFYEFTNRVERLAVWIVYLPALVMLLRRPNTADDVVAEPAPRRSFREWVETLPRVDAWLLILNILSAALYLLGFLTTRRA
jgi:hypothetical protein